ncbi:MAG: glutamine synthetase [Roseitalea sp.]|jgi:glutamine synthetase|uniref:glutamine synthetase family protein n=1 Tax=Oceaniradius stylonematis TaxID=2184161 RepID=UPI000D6C7868|nr:glutamine synthetase family protein [Oceaniradius stylonematis]MBO6553665.1 glutamine synthetase [Roseitalea sp.]MBO6952708.1 glutamine synthetase [Rhizobiaceae bacterium]RNC96407.1 MAG: glutamine synthetase [Oricola sp.]MBO6592805.1 glutamine synthetase [Roseitalea sp.]MBO6600452.1 glutamine synthetase [Roseitalea sp.]
MTVPLKDAEVEPGATGDPDMAEYDAFMAAHPDLQAVEFLIVDPNGVLRGKWAPADALKKAFGDGVNFPMSIHGLDVWGREVVETGLHIESGDLDGFFRAVPGSLTIVPWAKRKTAQVLLRGHAPDGTPLRFDCRNALGRITKALAKRGLHPVVAFELEFYLLEADGASGERTPQPVGTAVGPDRQRMYGLDDLAEYGPLFEDIRAAAHTQSVPIDTIVKEAAPGQFEVNLKHRRDPLRAADDVIMLRRIITGCARRHALQATFMAKPFIEYAGNGMHVHASIVDEAGNNIFAGGDGEARLGGVVAELIRTMPQALLLFINSWNGFRRIQPGSYAPTRAVWAHNNRSVALRIPASGEENRRVEHRIAGADANPYILLCAVLQAMMDGLEKMETPPPPIEGNAYDTTVGEQLPDDMDEALQLTSAGAFCERALGPELARIYRDLKRAEILAFWSEITPLERSTYL